MALSIRQLDSCLDAEGKRFEYLEQLRVDLHFVTHKDGPHLAADSHWDASRSDLFEHPLRKQVLCVLVGRDPYETLVVAPGHLRCLFDDRLVLLDPDFMLFCADGL